MAKQEINLGTGPNTGTGEPIRTAFGKVNENFTEVYDIAQGAFDEANSASELAQSAFDAANNAGGGSANTGDIQFEESEVFTETGRMTFYVSGAGEGEKNRIDVEADQFTVDVEEDINLYAGTDLELVSNNRGGQARTWRFKEDGNLQLPNGGGIVDNQGNSLLGGSANTGNITFDGTIISTAENEQRIQIQTLDDGGEWNTRITMNPEDVFIRLEARRDDKVSRIDLDQYDNERITIEGRDIDMIVDVDKDISIHSGDDIDITADDRMRITGDRVRIRSRSSEDTVEITTNDEDENARHTWAFNADGSLTLPGNGNYTISESEPGLILSSNFGVAIFTDAGDEGKAFLFGPDGELVLPTGGVIVEGEIDGNKTVEIVPGDPVSDDQRLIVKGGFLPGQEPHIHLTMGNLTEGSIFLGTDEHNVRTLTDGGMSISSYNYGIESSKTWEFDTDGTLHLPGNLSISSACTSSEINFVPNSSGDGEGYSTIELRPDTSLSENDQYLIIDPTSPNHIHIRAGGTIDNSNSALILGGETNNFVVYSGENPAVGITANNYSFTYGQFGYPTMSFPNVLFDDLPQAPGLFSGQRAFITDANLEAVGNFGQIVGGGGANSVPVWSDGANWRIG